MFYVRPSGDIGDFFGVLSGGGLDLLPLVLLSWSLFTGLRDARSGGVIATRH